MRERKCRTFILIIDNAWFQGSLWFLFGFFISYCFYRLSLKEAQKSEASAKQDRDHTVMQLEILQSDHVHQNAQLAALRAENDSLIVLVNMDHDVVESIKQQWFREADEAARIEGEKQAFEKSFASQSPGRRAVWEAQQAQSRNVG